MNIVKQVIDEKVKVALTKNKLKKEWLIWLDIERCSRKNDLILIKWKWLDID